MHAQSLRPLIACLASLAAFVAHADAPRRPLAPDDFYRLQVLSEPRVSPDGRWVAYVVTTNDRDADEARSALWMVSWDGKDRLPLTRPAAGTRAPRWSPDGRYLAFIATPPGSDKPQLMLLDRRGGEPVALTALAGDLGAFDWAPDGRRLVLAVQAGEDGLVESTDHGGAAARPPRPIVVEALHFKQDEEGYLGIGHPRRLYLLDVASRRLERLTRGAGEEEDTPAWSPDGARIAFVQTHEHGLDEDGRQGIAVVEARAGAEPRVLTRLYAPGNQQLAWRPDGSEIACLEGLEPRLSSYAADRLMRIPAAGGVARPVAPRLDRAVSSYAFAPDGAVMLATIEDDGAMVAARIALDDGSVERLTGASGTAYSISVGGGHVAALTAADAAADEVTALEGGGSRRLTTHNDEFLAGIELGAVEPLVFKSRDGTEIHGFVVKPPGYVAGRRYPTLLWIHGGPNGQDEHSLAVDSYQFKRQLLAAGGYVVVGINYRGSTGRGAAFAQSIAADWGHKEVEDLLAGMDAVVARGLADPERLGIGGWSYGGILTDYTIASDRRFKAAVSGAGSGNQLGMYGVDQYIGQYNAELGPPWRNPSLWLKVSYPFFHADRIRTPTLFMGGDKDFNVPIAGGEQMYQALRTLGVPTQLVVYPGQYHGFTRPSFLKDRAERILAWYGRFLGASH
jgi:dipeptidyl aminopeptidase/acylaminoacyl peptidase